jgi:hypothetical protein
MKRVRLTALTGNHLLGASVRTWFIGHMLVRCDCAEPLDPVRFQWSLLVLGRTVHVERVAGSFATVSAAGRLRSAASTAPTRARMVSH